MYWFVMFQIYLHPNIKRLGLSMANIIVLSDGARHYKASCRILKLNMI
ncbi:MAG: hypothetical protein QXY40_04120 [Candidatus Methanomethylicia archaeon]